jgi:hypothetical protein
MRTFVVLLALIAVASWAILSAISPNDAARAGESSLPGDTSCDGSVNSVDALHVLRHVAGLTGGECVDANGDVDCSGAVNAVDSLKILRHVAGLPVDLPQGCPPIGGGQTPGPEPTPGPEEPTSLSLIDEALEQGQIDADTALMYEVFAVYGDDRLPQEYRGSDEMLEDSLVTLELQARFDFLSPDKQTALAPFLLAPDEPGSWVELRESAGAGFQIQAVEWRSILTANGKVRVSWNKATPEDETKARAIADAIDERIWDQVTELMGREPYPDGGGGGTTNGGPDNLLDVWLVPMAAHGHANMIGGSCKNLPGYIQINRNHPQGTAGARATVAHELMHAVQFTYTVAEGCLFSGYKWWAEASATWIKDYVYPEQQYDSLVHGYAPTFMNTPQKPLETVNGDNRQYGGYLFAQYMAKQFDPALIRFAWETTEAAGQLDALSNNLDGFFEAQWPRFANSLWNQPPVDDFKQWDRLTKTPNVDTTIEVAPGPSGDRRYELDMEVDHLAIKYVRLKFTSPNTRSFAFYNGHNFNLVEQDFGGGATLFPQGATPEETKGAHIWGIAKINGQWQEPEDFSTVYQKLYCREIADQRLDELVLVFTNSEYEDTSHHTSTPGLPTTIWASNMACKRWTGHAESSSRGYGTDTLETKFNDVILEWDQSQDGQQFGPSYAYVVTGGSVDFRASGGVEGCTVTGEQSAIPLTDGSFANTSNFIVGGLNHRAAGGVLYGEEPGRYAINCPDNPPVDLEYDLATALYPLDATGFPAAEPGKVSADGTTFEGHYRVDFEGGGFFEVSWLFESDAGVGVGIAGARSRPPPP